MRFPHAGIYPANASADVAWSSLTRILAYIERSNWYQLVDFTLAANVQNSMTSQQIAIYVCPSEVQDVGKPATTTKGPASINRYPLNYATNVGIWMTWNPNSGTGGDGAITDTCNANGGNRVADFTDGLSNTIDYSEVNAHTWVMKADGYLPESFPIPQP